MKETDFNIILSRIKEKVLLSQIVGKDVVLQKKGREFSGNCPFHHEKTASFFVNDEKGSFHCFGCGASGDIITYLMKTKGVNFQQALEQLSQVAGIKLPEKNEVSHKNDVEQRVMQKAIEFYSKSLIENDAAQKYCLERGINKELIDYFSIGFSPYDGDKLSRHLRSCGFSEGDIVKSGIFAKKEGRLITRFKDRLMFPVFDRRGWPIAFGGRAIQKDAIPKYLNSSESEIFQKKEILYAYNIASRNVNEKTPFVVVEGYMDVVIMHKFGFKTAIASMGTAFTHEHLLKIWKYSNEPIICFDGDSAGYNAMVKLAFMAMKYISSEKSVRFCILPKNEDPDSFLSSYSCDAMQKLIDNSFQLIDFVWKYFQDEFVKIANKTPEHIAKWKKDILEIVEAITEVDVKFLYKSELKNRIFEHLRWTKKYWSKTTVFKNIDFCVNKLDKVLLREAVLLYTMLVCPSVFSRVIEKLSLVDFSDKGLDRLKVIMLESSDNSDFKAVFERNGEKETFEILEKIAENYCSFDNMGEEEILELWNDIFDTHFFKKAQRDDILVAKKECVMELNNNTWERFKALKIDILNKKKS